MQEALSVYKVDDNALLELRPDVILTQDHCKVCAVSLSDLSDTVRKALGKNTEIISVSPVDLESIFTSFKIISEKLGVPQRGENLIRNIQNRFSEISTKTKNLPKPNVVAIEWINPLMTAGNWMPELIRIAGGINHLSKTGHHSPVLKWEKIRTADPDILLVLPCGYPVEKTLNEMSDLENQHGWKKLNAVQTNNVYILDGNHYFNRSGPRIKDSVEILARIFHPEHFKPENQELPGWIQYSPQ